MKVVAEIFLGDENKVVEIVKEGKNRVKTLLSFGFEVKKYAKKQNKILKIKSDDPTVLSYFQENLKNVVVEQIE
ncbi:MAG: hypothetical protein H5T50_06395 [Nitrososphaeria archaeon]|nr:hypothetical protein [Nitrososphaeria archaeon]